MILLPKQCVSRPHQNDTRCNASKSQRVSVYRSHVNVISFFLCIQEVDQLRMERLQIDEQLRQIGGGPRAPSGRPEKEKPFSSDNGMGHSRGGKPFGRGGRGRRGPTFASGTQTSSKSDSCSLTLYDKKRTLQFSISWRMEIWNAPIHQSLVLWPAFVCWNVIGSGVSVT